MRAISVYAFSLALCAAPIASANAAEIYNDFYNHFNPSSSLQKDSQNPPDDVASWAYFANQADAFGGVIGFNGSTNKLDTFSVIMSNWNGWDPDGGVGTATPGYQTDLTLELFEVDRTGATPAPGASIVQDTETHDIAGRQIPDATNTSFVGNGTDFVVDWNLDGLSVGNELLFMVRVDDTDSGIFWRSDANTGGDISRFTANAFTDGATGGGQVFARATSVPLPGTLVLFLAGLVGIGVTYGYWRNATA